MRVCGIPECGAKHHAHGRCKHHYDQIRKIVEADYEYMLGARIENNSKLMPSGCVEWQGAYYNSGYGCIKVRGQTKLVHRVVWERAHGPIPEDMCICHHCDNRRCIGLDCMFKGTAKDNSEDMVRKGRQASGIKNGRAKFTWHGIARVKRLLAEEKSERKIALDFGVHHSTINDIARGKSWVS